MELRHLRCFVILAEELHFGRAAERLHVEQSPLSRTIRELEDRVGARLFNRDRRGTFLTHVGRVFLDDARRILASLDQAKENVRAVASGASGLLRLAVSDGTAQPRLATLLAQCREEEPGVEIRLSEVPLAELVLGLRVDRFDIGLACSADVGQDIDVYPVWSESVAAAVPARHPLLRHKCIPLDELLGYPLVLWHPDACRGYQRQIERLLHSAMAEPNVVERATSLDMMLTLVAAGFGVGLSASERVAMRCHPDVVVRPLALDTAELTTFLLAKKNAMESERLESFFSRVVRDSEIPKSAG